MHHEKLKMSDAHSSQPNDQRYPARELVRRLLELAWQFRGDCVASVFQSVALLLLGLAGLQLLGLVIDVIRHALDPAQGAPTYPFGLKLPAQLTPVQVVTVLSLGIVAQALIRALLTYQYN